MDDVKDYPPYLDYPIDAEKCRLLRRERVMGDRATLEKIFDIMRRLLLVKMDGLNPIPRKGTTRHECYRALYEIQELLETRRAFGVHLPQTNADRIRAMSDEELTEFLLNRDLDVLEKASKAAGFTYEVDREQCFVEVIDWLKQEVSPHDL